MVTRRNGPGGWPAAAASTPPPSGSGGSSSGCLPGSWPPRSAFSPPEARCSPPPIASPCSKRPPAASAHPANPLAPATSSRPTRTTRMRQMRALVPWPQLASPGVAPPVAADDEFLECTETVSSRPRRGIGVLKRGAEVGGEVACFAGLALCPEGFRRGRRRAGNDVEDGLRVRAAEPGPFEVQQRRHAPAAREPVAPVTVRVDRDDGLCVPRRALRYRRQAVEQVARQDW